MDKINNISFTGIRNIGFIEFSKNFTIGLSKHKSLSMVLSDDFNGKDLTEFLDVIKKIPRTQTGYLHQSSKNMLNIECATLNGEKLLSVNGRAIEVNDEHLPMFSYIARLTKKIAAMKDKDIVVNKTYKEYEAENALVYGENIIAPESNPSFFDNFFEHSAIKDGAKRVNEFIQSVMNKYFGIK